MNRSQQGDWISACRPRQTAYSGGKARTAICIPTWGVRAIALTSHIKYNVLTVHVMCIQPIWRETSVKSWSIFSIRRAHNTTYIPVCSHTTNISLDPQQFRGPSPPAGRIVGPNVNGDEQRLTHALLSWRFRNFLSNPRGVNRKIARFDKVHNRCGNALSCRQFDLSRGAKADTWN